MIKIGKDNDHSESNEKYSLNTPYTHNSHENSEEKKPTEENTQNSRWHIMPQLPKRLTKVVEEEKIDEDLLEDKKWKIRIGLTTSALLIAAFIAGCNKDKFFDSSKKTDDKQPNDITEATQDEEQDYDAALANNGATIEEGAQQTQEIQEDSQSIEEGAVDKVIGGKVLAFTDAYDDEQIKARAHDINTYLKASNVMDLTDEELCDQIKFINGTYNASTDDEAYDMLNECLETFGAYATATAQSANFAGGVVDDNGVIVALGLDAFLTDNCDHRELMDEVSDVFINVLESKTMGEKVDASKTMLKLESDLMLGQKETPNGTQLYFHSLTSSEAFITGLMFQNANATIHSALGENIEITYTDNVGQEVHVKYETLNEYYNPQCDGEYNTENAWAIVSTDLVETAIAKGLNLTPNR